MAAASKYLTEIIGTFFLVGTIGLATTTGDKGRDLMAPLAIGSALTALVYMGAHVSGAHYNPAVSLAVLVRGKMPLLDFIPYVISQLLGATLAALTVRVIRGPGAPFVVHPPDLSLPNVLLAEFLFTFALALVVVNVGTAPKNAGNSFYGLAIGFIVIAGALAVGPVSGGAFNPSVATGPTLVEAFHGGGGGFNSHAFYHLWIYWAAPLAGGLAAGIVCNFQVCGAGANSD